MLVTYCLGVLANHEPKAALADGLCTATLLAFRTGLHSFVRSVFSDDELRDALLFGVAAVVVLPLVPNAALDSLGVFNPFVLWRLVVLVMGMSGAGYIAQRLIGPRTNRRRPTRFPSIAARRCCPQPLAGPLQP